ncbi:MAG: DMT family transporter [Flavobacteriales bacterium]|nr:DMT family transporter [Flavobacteriales bacterium]MDG1396444.1 DMT family transporter [Flavobacteriales bacterium]
MYKGVKFMFISSFAFSLMHLCVKALPNIPVFELVFFRSFISLLISFTSLKSKNIPIFGVNKKILLIRGFIGVTALTLFFNTLQNIPLASAVTIQYLSPIFTALFAVWILKERMKKIQWVFFAMAFLGVFILKGFDTSGQLSYFYISIGLISACLSGVAYNCIRLLRKTEHPLVVVFYFPLVATPIMAVLSFFNWVQPQGIDWFYLLLLGILTQVAQIYMTKGIQSDSAGNIMIFKYIGVLFALIYGYLFFGETYSFLSILGIFTLILGVLLNMFFKDRIKV